MSLWLVVGGQFGSEGKGKVAAVIAQKEDVDLAIRCGGPNSGHSFVSRDGINFLVRELPTAFINPRTRLLIPAGATIDLDILRSEMDMLHVSPERVGVDRNAMVIEEADKKTEHALNLGERLSSTMCGVGAAAARRIMRSSDVRLASDAAKAEPWLRSMITDVSQETNEALDADHDVLIEGTQGFGLSLYHSTHYPKTTSKDTSAAALLSEVGVSPLRVTQIVMVLRTFPIRVAGAQAGPLMDEISWDALQQESGAPCSLAEKTTVTKMTRRVGRFDWELARRAAVVNRPTLLAINCLDHLDYANRGLQKRELLTQSANAFVDKLERELRTRVGFIGTGPRLSDVFSPERRSLNETVTQRRAS